MTTLLVDIDCKEDTCGDCQLIILFFDEARCPLFKKPLTGSDCNFLRCEECRWAEKFAADPHGGGSPYPTGA